MRMTRRTGALAVLYAIRADTQGPAAVATPPLSSGAVVTASPAASPSPARTPTASPLPPGTFENKVLGYRITLPERYRLGGSRITPGQPPYLGDDTYTPQTVQQGRERSLSGAVGEHAGSAGRPAAQHAHEGRANDDQRPGSSEAGGGQRARRDDGFRHPRGRSHLPPDPGRHAIGARVP